MKLHLKGNVKNVLEQFEKFGRVFKLRNKNLKSWTVSKLSAECFLKREVFHVCLTNFKQYQLCGMYTKFFCVISDEMITKISFLKNFRIKRSRS